MHIFNTKKVPITALKVGDSFTHIHYPDGRISMGPEYTVQEIKDGVVTCFDGWHLGLVNFDTDIIVEIDMTKDEVHARDFDKAKEVAQAMQHEMYDQGDAYHEMWNAWLDPDPYEMAKYCKENSMFIRGWFKLQSPKVVMSCECDIGIVAEDSCGDVFWCHAPSHWFSDWKKDYPELFEEG